MGRYGTLLNEIYILVRKDCNLYGRRQYRLFLKKYHNEPLSLRSDDGRFWHFLKLRYIGTAYILSLLAY